MRTTGFSLSPGGLLLPYHIGALEALEYNQQLTATTPIAGSSAGSIAVAAHGCGIDGPRVMEATAQIADECQAQGGTRGRLLPKLRNALDGLVTPEAFEQLQNRPGSVTVAYRQVLPRYRSMHQNEFEDKADLVNAICHSSTFPFFTTNWPVALDTSKRIPRLAMDGFFAVPRERFGCPDFEQAGVTVDRTVMISVFPQDRIGMDACQVEDCISPQSRPGLGQMENLLRLATQAATRKEYAQVYEAGYQDAEQWCRNHAEAKASVDMVLEGSLDSMVLN